MIIATNTNMSDLVFVSKIFKCFDKWCTVVGDDFTERAPSAKYVFKNPISNAFCILLAEFAEFWPTSKRTVALNDIFESSGDRHVHCVSENA